MLCYIMFCPWRGGGGGGAVFTKSTITIGALEDPELRMDPIAKKKEKNKQTKQCVSKKREACPFA